MCVCVCVGDDGGGDGGGSAHHLILLLHSVFYSRSCFLRRYFTATDYKW